MSKAERDAIRAKLDEYDRAAEEQSAKLATFRAAKQHTADTINRHGVELAEATSAEDSARAAYLAAVAGAAAIEDELEALVVAHEPPGREEE